MAFVCALLVEVEVSEFVAEMKASEKSCCVVGSRTPFRLMVERVCIDVKDSW